MAAGCRGTCASRQRTLTPVDLCRVDDHTNNVPRPQLMSYPLNNITTAATTTTTTITTAPPNLRVRHPIDYL